MRRAERREDAAGEVCVWGGGRGGGVFMDKNPFHTHIKKNEKEKKRGGGC